MDRVYSGFKSLDGIIKIKKGDLIVIESRPAVGKTCLICSMINNVIDRQKTLLFSMQLNKHLAVDNLENNLNNNANFNLIKEIIDLDEIILKVAETKLKYGLDVLFIDNFTEFCNFSVFTARRIIERLKKLAVSFNVAVIVTEELARNESMRYCIYDIRHNEFINYADKILTLYRLDLEYSKEDLELNCMEENSAVLCVEKDLNATTNEQGNLTFDRNTLTFTDFINHID